jgi:hypothetical protein
LAGFFEGQKSTDSRITNQNGEATISYYGPLANELLTSGIVYISAVLAGEGKEYIAEMTPIYIIRDLIEVIFELIAVPNVVWTTTQKTPVDIRAIIQKTDGIPLAGVQVFFTILSGPGEFSDKTRRTFAYTNESGIASVSYLAPRQGEIDKDQFVTFKAQPQTASPNYIHKEVDVRLLKGN